jgi:phosphatidylethanolamine-binding protein (PEBP) family uncharacterized protein
MSLINERKWITLLAFAAALALAGCGSSGSQSQASAASATTAANTAASQISTSASGEQAQNRAIEFSSPAIPNTAKGHPTIPARYTCDGANTPPPLRWSNIPAGARELVLIIPYVDRARKEYRYDWAVAGLKPTLHGLSAGKLPPGAIVGRNSDGQTRYSVCPPEGVSQGSGILLYALPHHIALKPGFQAKALFERANNEAVGHALIEFLYKRR